MGARTAYGLPLSTTPEVAEALDAYVDAMIAYSASEVDLARAVRETDPSFAVGRALWALVAFVNGEEGVDLAAETAAARAATARHEWERSLVAALTQIVSDGSFWPGYPDLLRHAHRFPGDLIGTDLAAFVQSISTEPDRWTAIEGRARETLGAVGRNPSSLALLGYGAHEARRFEESLEWTAQLFEIGPHHVHGAHNTVHVAFERGEHSAGLSWLREWYAVAERDSPYFPHLRWHAGLHELALGDQTAALDTLAELAREPGMTVGGDLGGLSVRCQLDGCLPWGQVPDSAALDARVDFVSKGAPPAAAAGFMVSTLWLARGDAEALRRYAADAPSWSTPPGARELLPGLAAAYADFVEGDWAGASDGLSRLEPEFGRFGGSHAQREVAEYVLIEALIRAGRNAEAITRIDARLARRDSRFDRRWRARATATAVRPQASAGGGPSDAEEPLSR